MFGRLSYIFDLISFISDKFGRDNVYIPNTYKINNKKMKKPISTYDLIINRINRLFRPLIMIGIIYLPIWAAIDDTSYKRWANAMSTTPEFITMLAVMVLLSIVLPKLYKDSRGTNYSSYYPGMFNNYNSYTSQNSEPTSKTGNDTDIDPLLLGENK